MAVFIIDSASSESRSILIVFLCVDGCSSMYFIVRALVRECL